MQSKHRIDGKFYPVQREEILKLRKLKLINNTAFVYFALKYENPFCNRPIEIQTAEFCLRWGLPESSLYKAIAALKEHNALKIHNRSILIEWAESTENSLPHSQQVTTTRNGESILGSENGFSDLRMDTYIDHARGESLEFLDPPLPPAGESDGGEKSLTNSALELAPNHLSSLQDLSIELKEAITMNGKGFSAAGHQGKIVVSATGHQGNVELGASGHAGSVSADASGHGGDVASPLTIGHSGDITAEASGHSGDVSNNFFPLDLDKMPRSLLEKAKDLGISFDQEIVGAIKEHHQSQFMGALKEMEEYTGTIKHPNKFLLKKLPKMPKEKLGLLMPMYSADWLDKPADPCPPNIKNELNGLMEKLMADRAKAKARKNC